MFWWWSLLFAVLSVLTFQPIDGLRANVMIPRASIRSIKMLSEVQESIHPLSLSFPELTHVLDGSGKAKAVWKSLRQGLDPLQDNLLSMKAKQLILNALSDQPLLQAVEVSQVVSDCGTRKLLLQLADGQEVESVLIPSTKYNRTTLCVSSQVGCDRGCAFCLTGKMGLVRNLTAVEIVSQVVHGLRVSRIESMPPLLNSKSFLVYFCDCVWMCCDDLPLCLVVFMGMGDAGRNLVNVRQAVECLVDPDRFSFSRNKVTVSTIGPSPNVFAELATMPACLAWSLHTPNDGLRKMLVPSTRHSMIELRDAIIHEMTTLRDKNHRTLMIACTLIKGINDSDDDAIALADFVQPMAASISRVMIDLIPYNDIRIERFDRPSRERINAFQKILTDRGLFCAVRLPRGDDHSAACGMLATKRRPRTRVAITTSNA